MNVERDTAASRIVEIQRRLAVNHLSAEDRSILIEEQRRLWDANYSGEPFDRIAHDVWLVKRRNAYG